MSLLPYTKNYSQLRSAENEGNSIIHGRMNQSIIWQQMVSTESMVQIILYGPSKLDLIIYICIYIYIEARNHN